MSVAREEGLGLAEGAGSSMGSGFMSLEDKKSKIGEETKLRSFSRSKLSSISKVYSFKVVAKRCKHCAGPVSPVCLLSRRCLLGFHVI